MSQRVYGVGKVEYRGDLAIKTIDQTVSGSAYMKVSAQVIALHQAGYKEIQLRINKTNPYMLRIEDQLSFLRKNINVKLIKF